MKRDIVWMTQFKKDYKLAIRRRISIVDMSAFAGFFPTDKCAD